MSDDNATEPNGDEDVAPAGEVEAVGGSSPMPFEALRAPRPTPATPPAGARWLAFVSITISGLLGGLIGYGTADLMVESSVAAAAGGLIGALVGAVGVGIVAGLTLRAMGEWRAVQHPEAGS